MDYFYQELRTPYPLTVEVYGPHNTGKLKTAVRHIPRRELQGADAEWASARRAFDGDEGRLSSNDTVEGFESGA